jgi:catechol 2,3-dioxygenase-like lactoylglutathione lyase family enzyme
VRVLRVVPDLRCDDPAAAAEFYAGLLGMDVGMDLGWIVNFGSVTHPLAQVNVMSSDATAGDPPALSIEVDDVDAVHAEAVRRALDIVHPLTTEPWGVRRFFVRDPTGAVVNVMQHTEPRGPGT